MGFRYATKKEGSMESVLGTIRMYAREHNLTSEQIGAIFDAGCMACADADLYGLREPGQITKTGG